MWDLLKQADIELAKQQLKLRRVEILRRQAEESQNLHTDQAELETLNQLADAFSQKFAKPKTLSHESIPSPITYKNIGHQISPEVRHQHHRAQSQTNFDTFARAVARG